MNTLTSQVIVAHYKSICVSISRSQISRTQGTYASNVEIKPDFAYRTIPPKNLAWAEATNLST